MSSGRPSLPPPPTRLLNLPGRVSVEYLVTGDGEPVTLFAHGFAGGIADTRPFGSGVPGSKVFMHLRGHGRSQAPATGWGYADLAGDITAVADATGATRALGVSLGAGALCRLAAQAPQRFQRLVFFLPAVLDLPRQGAARTPLHRLAEAVRTGSVDVVASLVERELPAPVRQTPAARAFVAQRVSALLTHEGLASAMSRLADDPAVEDLSSLRQVRAAALVLGCQGDDSHPAEVAERLAAALPSSALHMYDEPGVLWTCRADLRARISGFLS